MFVLYLLHSGLVHTFELNAENASDALLEACQEYIFDDKGWEFWKLEKK